MGLSLSLDCKAAFTSRGRNDIEKKDVSFFSVAWIEEGQDNPAWGG